jgi:hypothetical protein
MSALPLKADIRDAQNHVRFGPTGDMETQAFSAPVTKKQYRFDPRQCNYDAAT